MTPVTPILRTKDQARRFYDRISSIYDWLTASEKSLIKKGAAALSPQPGERIFEIGCGTGTGLALIEKHVKGCLFTLGLDLSRQMLLKSFEKSAAGLVQGDAASLPLASNLFNGGFCSFTLELFSQKQIPIVLREIRRVLNPDGRFVVIALSRHRENLAVRLYEFAHRIFPVAVDCRPIPLTQILTKNGFRVQSAVEFSNWGLPIQMVECKPIKNQHI